MKAPGRLARLLRGRLLWWLLPFAVTLALLLWLTREAPRPAPVPMSYDIPAAPAP